MTKPSAYTDPAWIAREARRQALEEAAKVAELAIDAGELVRRRLAPESPVVGLDAALHAIVVSTAKGIAANIRALKDKQP
jgi:hypothetical protein